MTAHGWLIPALPAAVAAMGVVPLWLGLRGRRVDQHPVCRRCAYDLVGLPADHAACPECGSDLRRPRAIRVGNRRRRAGLVMLAGLLLVPSLGALGVIGWASARGADVQTYKPVWWLVNEADGVDAATRAASFAELTSRLTSAKLSDSEVRAVVDRALQVQGDTAKTWDPAWGDWVEQARMLGWLTFEQWQRYVEQGIDVGVKVRAGVRRGDPLPYQVRVTARLSRSGLYQFDLFGRQPQFHFDGVPQPPGTDRIKDLQRQVNYQGEATGRTQTLGMGVLPLNAIPLDRLRDGPHTVRLVLDVAVHQYPSASNRLPIVWKRVAPEAAWELLPADRSSVRTVIDPALANSVRASLTAPYVYYDKSGYLSTSLSARNCPVPLAFDVWLRTELGEWRIGRGSFPRDGGSISVGDFVTGANSLLNEQQVPTGKDTVPTSRLNEFTGNVVDIVLRPNAAEASRSLVQNEFWGEEIVISNVPAHHPRRSR
jgi:hypothetical protein